MSIGLVGAVAWGPLADVAGDGALVAAPAAATSSSAALAHRAGTHGGNRMFGSLKDKTRGYCAPGFPVCEQGKETLSLSPCTLTYWWTLTVSNSAPVPWQTAQDSLAGLAVLRGTSN